MRVTSGKRTWLRLLAACAVLAFAGGARAAKADEAKLEISGLGWFGDRDLRNTLELLLGKERGPVLTANAIEDAMFLLMSAVQENGYLKPTIAVELTGEDGKKSEFTLDA